ncbi:hypothetical protein PR048_031651 [Dryococelus australis]|uniref:Uncharacterized protein n=1 Tax=Dryococelus australis TaxID=614101 RepID=A0ABQ9G5X0_9NEOP|nr:hypothetical protein PR048_031651 [Dryococelus australis]
MDTTVANHNSTTPSTLVNPNRGLPTATPTIDREQMKLEFYSTYDVMIGVRIAATLGGFFSLMVLLVVYKSKCKSKSLSDEDLTAAAAATAVSDEEKDIGFSAPFMFAPETRRGQRQSLGNMSAPAFVRTRFSSIGGYSTLDASPFLNYQRGKSLPGSALQFPFAVGNTSATASSYLAEPEDSFVESPSCYYHRFLTVPQDERRLSSITCSSSDTSYLERRGSAVEMGLPAPPPKAGAAQEMWDFYYPIDIQIIQPTPEVSPCGSERTLYDHPVPEGKMSLGVPRLAPLASISSCAASLSDYSEHSVGSDSVFMDDDEELDTEDEVEGFSTDSEGTEVGEKRLPPSSAPFAQHLLQVPVPTSVAPAGRWAPAAAGYHPKRRFSAPCHKKSACETISALVDEPVTEVTPSQRPQYPLPISSSESSDSVTIPAVVCDSPTSCEKSQRSKSLLALPSFPLLIGGSCEHLARVLRNKTSSSVTDNCAWSQETLF